MRGHWISGVNIDVIELLLKDYVHRWSQRNASCSDQR